MSHSGRLALDQIAERSAEVRERLLTDTFGARKTARLQELQALESKLDNSFRGCTYYQIQPAARERIDRRTRRLAATRAGAAGRRNRRYHHVSWVHW